MNAIELAKEYIERAGHASVGSGVEPVVLAQTVLDQAEALKEAEVVLKRLVGGFDKDIATTPNSFAAKDCRDWLDKYAPLIGESK